MIERQTGPHASVEKAQQDRLRLLKEIEEKPHQFRIVTGDRPTGHLHLGHLLGSLENRLLLAQKGIPLYNVIADYQAFFDRERSDHLQDSVYSLALDYASIGLLDHGAILFRHSRIPAIHELFLCFLGLFSVAELERNPTVKDEFRSSGQKNFTALFLTYPVHQVADVLCVRANLVPVGQDQLPHIELIRKAAQRFNHRYQVPLFEEPDPLLSAGAKILGLDGEKMSKSRYNGIFIHDDPDTIRQKFKKAKTDSIRDIYYDPEHRPEISQLLFLLAHFSHESIEQVTQRSFNGFGHLKEVVSEAVIEGLAPYRQRRLEIKTQGGIEWIESELKKGEERVQAEAAETLKQVKEAMGLL